MAFVEQFVRRPQNLWLRRAIFQIHFWTGIAMGLYVIAFSVGGSALFFRNKINERVSGGKSVPGSGPLLTGAVIWWPGIANWRRSLKINPRANWKRINWDLHSAMGFWTFAFFFMWSFTGVYLVFPAPFDALINRVAPLEYYLLSSQPAAP